MVSVYTNVWLFFGFCLIWAVGGSKVGQNTGWRLTKTLPARQTHFGGVLGQPLGENTFSKNAPPKNSQFSVPGPWILFSGTGALQNSSGMCLHASGMFVASELCWDGLNHCTMDRIQTFRFVSFGGVLLPMFWKTPPKAQIHPNIEFPVNFMNSVPRRNLGAPCHLLIAKYGKRGHGPPVAPITL